MGRDREAISSLIPTGDFHHDARQTKGHLGDVDTSSSYMAENDEQENLEEEISLDWISGDSSNPGANSPSSMATSTGGSKGISWGRDTVESRGPGEPMERGHDSRLSGSEEFEFDTNPETAPSAGTND